MTTNLNDRQPGETTLQYSIRLWKIKRYADATYATAVSELKPQDVDLRITGDFLSCTFSPGVRTYMFHGQTNRDRFVNHYRGRGFGAKPCKDPHP